MVLCRVLSRTCTLSDPSTTRVSSVDALFPEQGHTGYALVISVHLYPSPSCLLPHLHILFFSLKIVFHTKTFNI